MDIKDFIKSDKDRLFVVDPECFIVFTGDTLDNEKPFIRIGNWIDLPAGIIPFIENIIVSDNIVGNPSFEQFNIDIKQLHSNKYIGIEHIVKKFLEFQKLFFLDIKNTSTVNIEKDIPELSKNKNESSENQYVGIFYRNNNFRILHNQKDIFDLNEIEEEHLNYNKIHDKISKSNKSHKRYNGQGLFIIDKNPIFYNNNNFISYLFPTEYFNEFSNLNVDPDRLRHILYPSINFTNLIRFLKWKSKDKRKITVYSDYPEKFTAIKNLFSYNSINIENFDGFQYSASKNFTASNYKNTNNIELTYKNVSPINGNVTISYIKEPLKIKSIIRKQTDAIFIDYSIYEKFNLLFKSSKSPTVIIDDGNKNISRLSKLENIILYPNIQYSIQKHNDIGLIHQTIPPDINCNEIISSLSSNRINEIVKIIKELLKTEKDRLNLNIKLFNIKSLLNISLFKTENRKLSSLLNKINQELLRKIDMNILFRNSNFLQITLVFYEQSIFQFIKTHRKINPISFKDDTLINRNIPSEQDINFKEADNERLKESDQYKRIAEDRIRLNRLLNLYIKRANIRIGKDKIEAISKEISKRKEIFLDNSNSNIESLKPGIGKIFSRQSVPSKKQAKQNADNKKNNSGKKRINHSQSENIPDDRIDAYDVSKHNMAGKQGFNHIFDSIRQIAIIKYIKFLIPALIFIIGFLFYNLYYKKQLAENSLKQKIKIEQEKIKKDRERTITFARIKKKYSFKITNNDLHNYANKIALKNGFNKISFIKDKEKNPDWIYPSNIFILSDGEKVVVNKGDTLLIISERKLIKMSIEFYKALEKINSPDKGNHTNLLNNLKKHAFSKKHFKIIKKLERSE